jgi:hypothetical protein
LGVTSTIGEYRNCYTCFSGGIYTLVSTKIVDTNSKYYQNAALLGGVIYCDNCLASITTSQIHDNDAISGGVLYS